MQGVWWDKERYGERSVVGQECSGAARSVVVQEVWWGKECGGAKSVGCNECGGAQNNTNIGVVKRAK